MLNYSSVPPFCGRCPGYLRGYFKLALHYYSTTVAHRGVQVHAAGGSGSWSAQAALTTRHKLRGGWERKETTCSERPSTTRRGSHGEDAGSRPCGGLLLAARMAATD